MLGIWLFCQSKTTKYSDAAIACFGSLLELHEYKHSFVSVFDKIYVIFMKLAHFLVTKFDIFEVYKPDINHPDSQVSLHGRVVEHLI